jgi:hypothetical protein
MGAGAGIASTGKFDWGAVGNVQIKSMTYSMFIDQGKNQEKTKLPGSRITESLLTWVNKEFTLEDIRCIDYDSGKTVEFPHLQARFRLNDSWEFEDLIDTETLISNFEANCKRVLNQERREKVIKSFTVKCKDFWNNIKTFWIKNSQFLTKRNSKLAGCDCFELNLVKKVDRKNIHAFLDKKYEPDNIGEVSYGLKGKITVEKRNARPLRVFISRSTYAEVEKEEEILSEVTEDYSLFILCWEEYPILASDEFIRSEVRKFNELVKIVAKEFKNKELLKSRSKIL